MEISKELTERLDLIRKAESVAIRSDFTATLSLLENETLTYNIINYVAGTKQLVELTEVLRSRGEEYRDDELFPYLFVISAIARFEDFCRRKERKIVFELKKNNKSFRLCIYLETRRFKDYFGKKFSYKNYTVWQHTKMYMTPEERRLFVADKETAYLLKYKLNGVVHSSLSGWSYLKHIIVGLSITRNKLPKNNSKDNK